PNVRRCHRSHRRHHHVRSCDTREIVSPTPRHRDGDDPATNRASRAQTRTWNLGRVDAEHGLALWTRYVHFSSPTVRAGFTRVEGNGAPPTYGSCRRSTVYTEPASVLA